ncbi:unnamed protein product [Schistosoma margrebowiei]|uniref:Uncharacterized protein n=1 Tax=Schistosoma margrebowiei TaxID=48269 RepID=A0AA84Z7N6_9TREM|nr:unnamed protein product [Schistosoma margrebowiei]
MASKKSPSNLSNRKTKEITLTNPSSSTPRDTTIPLWPEWNDQDVNNEKWDSSQKTKEKSKSSAQSSSSSTYFIDPESQILYPSSMIPFSMKRPNEFITEKAPVVYDPEFINHVDLLYYNEHLFKNELLRWIICDIQNLWLSCRTPMPESIPPTEFNESNMMMNLTHLTNYNYEWKPWEHIYAMTKITKDNNNTPQYNPYGKYIASNDSLITVHLRLSVPNVYTRLCIKMGNKEMIFAEGYGGACIFAYIILADTIIDDKNSQTSNSGRLLEVNKGDNVKLSIKDVTNTKVILNKLNTTKVSPRRSASVKKNMKPGSSSGSSTGGSTAGSGRGSSSNNSANIERSNQYEQFNSSSPHSHRSDSQQIEGEKEEERYYWIEAYVDGKNWPLSISNWSFLEDQRCNKLEECQVNNTTSRNTSADKSSDSRTIKSATKSPGNKTIGITGQKSGSTRGTSAKIDFNQAHWKMRIICNNSNDIKIINMDNKILEIKALKRAWEEMEPGRAIRAELSRARYLEEYGLMNKLDNKTNVDDSGSMITITSDDNQIQTIKDHSPLDHTLLSDPSKIYILKFPPELNPINID